MAWLASLASAGIGAAASDKASKETKKGLNNASAEQRRSLLEALAGTSEYQGVGRQGALNIGQLMGLEGFRTKSDIALRELLASKPVLGDAGKVKKETQESILSSSPGQRVLNEINGGNTPMGYLRKKRGKKQAKNEAIKAEEFRIATAAWEAKRAELEKQRDIELQTYDPTAKLRSTPGYDYRYNTGLTTTNNSLSRLGMRESGRERKELTNYGQEFASNEFGNEFNRNLQLMSGGQSLAGLTGGWNIGQGNSLANIAQAQGQNQANYYGNLNNVGQGSLANLTYGMDQRADRRSSSYTPTGSMTPRTENRNWWEQ